MSKKLTDRDISFLKLLIRSRDIGDGWRKVTPILWSLVTNFSRAELIDINPLPEGGGHVRLSDRGSIVCDYI